MTGQHQRIPGHVEWSGYESDLDVRHAHELFFGKSTAEVQQYFGGGDSIWRMDELLFMPRAAFQYYVFAFAEFMLSDAAAGDSDSASCFLHLLVSRERRDPGSVETILSRLMPTVLHVAARQEYYDADPNIYGRFEEHAAALQALCKPGD